MPIEISHGSDRGRSVSLPPAELVACEPIRHAIEAWNRDQKAARAAGQDATVLEQERPQASAGVHRVPNSGRPRSPVASRPRVGRTAAVCRRPQLDLDH